MRRAKASSSKVKHLWAAVFVLCSLLKNRSARISSVAAFLERHVATISSKDEARTAHITPIKISVLWLGAGKSKYARVPVTGGWAEKQARNFSKVNTHMRSWLHNEPMTSLMLYLKAINLVFLLVFLPEIVFRNALWIFYFRRLLSRRVFHFCIWTIRRVAHGVKSTWKALHVIFTWLRFCWIPVTF